MLIVPRDLATPLIKDAILDLNRGGLVRGIGFEYQMVQSSSRNHSWVDLGTYGTLGIQLDQETGGQGKLPKIICYKHCFFIGFVDGCKLCTECEQWVDEEEQQMSNLGINDRKVINYLVTSGQKDRSEFDMETMNKILNKPANSSILDIINTIFQTGCMIPDGWA